MSRSDHQNWVLHSSTNSRCSATQQRRSPRRYMFRSTGLVTDISKNSMILLLCWNWHSMRIGMSDLQRQSPKIQWPRRQWPRSKRVCTWRRRIACKLNAGRFQQEVCLFSGVSTRHQRMVLKMGFQLVSRGSRGYDDVQAAEVVGWSSGRPTFPLGYGMLIRSTVGDQSRPIQQHKYVQQRIRLFSVAAIPRGSSQ